MAKSSPPYALRHRESLRPGLIRILNTMGRDARKLSEMPENELGESIHGLRILIKRLRAYMWFLRPALGKSLYAKSNYKLSKAAQRLSSARDLHAVASALTKAAAPQTDEKHLQALSHVSRAFALQTATAQESTPKVQPLDEVADSIIQSISQLVKIAKENADKWPHSAHRIKKAFNQTRKAMKKSLRRKDVRFVHEWRKKAKRLFYLLQLTARLPHANKPDCLNEVDELQETLGNFQDTVVAENHLRKSPPDTDATHIEHAVRLLQINRDLLLEDAHHHSRSIFENI